MISPLQMGHDWWNLTEMADGERYELESWRWSESDTRMEVYWQSRVAQDGGHQDLPKSWTWV